MKIDIGILDVISAGAYGPHDFLGEVEGGQKFQYHGASTPSPDVSYLLFIDPDTNTSTSISHINLLSIEPISSDVKSVEDNFREFLFEEGNSSDASTYLDEEGLPLFVPLPRCTAETPCQMIFHLTVLDL